jgi:hypothetical protein
MKPLAPPNPALPDYDPRKREEWDSWLDEAIAITKAHIEWVRENSGRNIPEEDSEENPCTGK